MNGKLHHYTADTSDRTNVHIFLFLISIGSAWGFVSLCNYWGWTPYWWIDTPSVFGFYGIYFSFFNNFIWKISFLRKIGLIKTPNLNGQYEGEIKSSYDSFQTSKKVQYEIVQKWNKILIFSETETSTSKSLTAAFSLSDVNRKSIVFSYQNTPKIDADKTMNTHCGFADFYFTNADAIIGEFFNGRNRNTHGKIVLKKKN